MKKIVIGFLIVALICAAGFGFYSLYNSSITNGENGPGVNEDDSVTNNEDQSVINRLIEVEEEYYDSVNADITLEQLQNSKLVANIEIYNEGSSLAKAFVSIFNVKVIGIDGRTLTLTKGGDILRIYIGESARIGVDVPGTTAKPAKFEEIKINDSINIGAILQIARDDPLWIYYLVMF